MATSVRRVVRGWMFAVCVAGSTGLAQQGPPPEVRSHVQAILAAFNSGSAAEWEAMAQAHFAPAALARRTPEDRRRLFEQLHADFGTTVSSDRLTRRGPDAPLEIAIRGVNGVEGTIRLELEASAPYRIVGMAVGIGRGEREPGPEVPAPPISGTMPAAQLTRALDEYLAKLAAEDRFSGVALVAKDGTPIFEKAYGFADRANRVPNTPATRFNLGSINKVFTQVAVAKLATQAKLSYTDTLGKLIPDYPQETTRAATVEQLLNHTAGIADFFGEAFAKTPKDRFRSNTDYYRFVSGLPPLFAPGERNQYCNGCYITVGEIIARVSGVPYEKYVAEHVFTPAGMTGAGYVQADAIEPNVAMGYTRRLGGDGQLRSNIYGHGAAGSAAGGGYATAKDLLAFDNAFREGRLLDAAGVARILRGDPAAAGTAGRARGDISIGGGAPGINSVLASDGTWTVVVVTNLDPRFGEATGTAIKRALSR